LWRAVAVAVHMLVVVVLVDYYLEQYRRFLLAQLIQ
jgi:hypothetical protein